MGKAITVKRIGRALKARTSEKRQPTGQESRCKLALKT